MSESNFITGVCEGLISGWHVNDTSEGKNVYLGVMWASHIFTSTVQGPESYWWKHLQVSLGVSAGL